MFPAVVPEDGALAEVMTIDRLLFIPEENQPGVHHANVASRQRQAGARLIRLLDHDGDFVVPHPDRIDGTTVDPVPYPHQCKPAPGQDEEMAPATVDHGA